MVALGGLILGWLVYRNVKCRRAEDKPADPAFSRTSTTSTKLYDFLFIKPAILVCRSLRLQVDGPGRDRRHPAHLRPSAWLASAMSSAITSTCRLSTS
ncbi:MAG: hypothetical protein M0C28_28445 [Candidatus Moduliflexus flocculans]|nr:hypothetical protein [Candidatus Moduliflexus flocculans]